MMTLTGGCLCGAVRYEIDYEGERGSTCHCAMCRRQSGGAFMGFVTVPRGHLRLTGELKTYRSSEIGLRSFCPNCGTPITMDYSFEDDRTGVVTGSLDDPEAVPPSLHWGAESMLSWLKLEDGLPRMTTDEDPEFVEALRRLGERDR
ncbi:GFA family protein [Microbaculum marinum]|uniref:GFA family protein n=1 Tax=Microbaculum marinum TaxID=1764581 RepID=A0AAW9S408_9HYPH